MTEKSKNIYIGLKGAEGKCHSIEHTMKCLHFLMWMRKREGKRRVTGRLQNTDV